FFFGHVGADVLGDAARLAGDHVGHADAVEQQGLAVVDVAHDGDDRRAGPQVFLGVVLVAEHGLEGHLLLLAGVDEQDVGAQFGGEQLDHVVGQRLGGRHHLALLEQEADDVGRGAVQLGAQLLGRGAALDDDLALGDGGVGARVGRRLRRLQFLEAATATATALGGTATLSGAAGTAGTATRAAAGGRRTAGTAGRAAGAGAGALARRAAGTSCTTGAAGPTPAAARGGRDGTAGGRSRRAAGRRRDGTARARPQAGRGR